MPHRMPLILSFENWLLGNDKALEYSTFKVKNNVKIIKSNEKSISILIIVIIEESKKKKKVVYIFFFTNKFLYRYMYITQ